MSTKIPLSEALAVASQLQEKIGTVWASELAELSQDALALENQIQELTNALRGFLWMLNEGHLVRNIENDGRFDWTRRAMRFTLWLAEVNKLAEYPEFYKHPLSPAVRCQNCDAVGMPENLFETVRPPEQLQDEIEGLSATARYQMGAAMREAARSVETEDEDLQPDPDSRLAQLITHHRDELERESVGSVAKRIGGMRRCVNVRGSRQCLGVALVGSDFCAEHTSSDGAD